MRRFAGAAICVLRPTYGARSLVEAAAHRPRAYREFPHRPIIPGAQQRIIVISRRWGSASANTAWRLAPRRANVWDLS